MADSVKTKTHACVAFEVEGIVEREADTRDGDRKRVWIRPEEVPAEFNKEMMGEPAPLQVIVSKVAYNKMPRGKFIAKVTGRLALGTKKGEKWERGGNKKWEFDKFEFIADTFECVKEL